MGQITCGEQKPQGYLKFMSYKAIAKINTGCQKTIKDSTVVQQALISNA